MQQAHSVVQVLAAGEIPVYGVNTDFGKLSNAHVATETRRAQ